MHQKPEIHINLVLLSPLMQQRPHSNLLARMKELLPPLNASSVTWEDIASTQDFLIHRLEKRFHPAPELPLHLQPKNPPPVPTALCLLHIDDYNQLHPTWRHDAVFKLNLAVIKCKGNAVRLFHSSLGMDIDDNRNVYLTEDRIFRKAELIAA